MCNSFIVDSPSILTAEFDSFVFSCLLDICSHFTTVPLTEAISICATALYESDLKPSPFSHLVFIELMQMAASIIEFSFNNVMYWQFDDTVMVLLSAQHLRTFLLAIAKANLMYSDTSMTPLLSFTIKKNATSFLCMQNPYTPFFASPLKKRIIIPYLFWTYW